MANVQILKSELHKNLRYQTAYTRELGYAVGAMMVMPCEIPSVQREYPLLFRKHSETGTFFLNALLGFEEDENLFVDRSGVWHAGHVPFAAQKGPFLIGSEASSEYPGQQDPVVCVDIDDPHFSSSGEPLFTESGALTPHMEKVSQVLLAMHQDAKNIEAMTNLFLEFDLIEPLSLKATLDDGQEIGFEGGYTIAQEKLDGLSAERLFTLNKSGFLGAAYMISSSLQNVQRLLDIKNAK